MIETKHVRDRRMVRFTTLRDVVDDLAMLAEAERAGQLQQLGNWPLGITAGHLAAFIDYAFDGYPMPRPIWIIRVAARLMKKRFIEQGMSPGMRLPGKASGTYGDEPMTTDAGLAKLRAATARLEKQAPPRPNQLFGPLTHEEWIKLHLRHAELHASFYKVI